MSQSKPGLARTVRIGHEVVPAIKHVLEGFRRLVDYGKIRLGPIPRVR